MLNPISRTNPNSTPKVLLQAKKEATIQVMGKDKPWNKARDKGPWDKGHWANRK
ncbi:hypothetical protein KKH35_03400 [Patescibacteria group bacterium]|nr:hypothetical protein [Patescibacteria group bacterium]